MLELIKTPRRALGRCRGGPLLSSAETTRSLEFVRECCARQRRPIQFLSRTMGCSEKTARRMLSQKHPYSSRLKRAYAATFAVNMGIPLEAVTRPVDLEYAEALKGWPSVGPASLATKVAAALGAGIATRSMRVCDMLADFTVYHGADGRPSAVSVSIAPEMGTPARHTLAIAESSYTGGMLHTHYDTKNAQRSQVTPSEEIVDRILKSIKDEQKNNTTKRK